jgi:hypothetical protein
MNAYEEKRQARIERLQDAAERKAKESTAAYERSRKMASAIPFGQPIHVGHYSEKGDRSYRAKIGRLMDKSCELGAESKELAARAEAAEANDAISSDDPEAVVKLKVKLAGMKAQQALGKAANAAHKKFLKDPASLDAANLPDKTKETIRNYKPAYSWEPHPMPPYWFSNLGANIRRVEQRIKQLESQVDRTAAEPVEADWGRLVENVEANRLQMFFPGKPSEAIRACLKSHGFRWAPSEGAWQRQLHNGSKYAAECVIKKIEELKGESHVSATDQSHV